MEKKKATDRAAALKDILKKIPGNDTATQRQRVLEAIKALYELRALGFLAVTREGGLRMGTRVCTLYRFTDLEVYEQPKVGVQSCKATHDYLRFGSVRDAEQARPDGIAQLQAAGKRKRHPRKKSPIQKLNPISSETEPIEPFISSETEQGASASVQKLIREISPEFGPQSHAA